MIFKYNKDTQSIDGIVTWVKSLKKAKVDVDTLMPQFDKLTALMEQHGMTAEDAAKIYNGKLDPAVVDYCSTAQAGELTQEGFRRSLENTSLSAKATTVAMKALSIAGNMLLAWGISEAINGVYQLITYHDKLAESAANLSSEFKNTESSINDYKSEIESLYQTINDSSSSFNDTKEARQRLLEIQNEMIEKFGEEKDAIDAITEAVNGNTEAFDTLTNQQYQKMIADFNKTDGWVARLQNSFAGSNFDQMKEDMQSYSVSLGTVNEEIESILKSNGGELVGLRDGRSIYQFNGSLREVYDTLIDIQDATAGINKGFSSDLANQISDVDDLLSSYDDMYNYYLLQEKILNPEVENDYDDWFYQLKEAAKAYEEAFTNGDENATREAAKTYATILGQAKEYAESRDGVDSDYKGIIDYFEGMYPVIIQEYEKLSQKAQEYIEKSDQAGKTIANNLGVEDQSKTYSEEISKYAEEHPVEFDAILEYDNENFDKVTAEIQRLKEESGDTVDPLNLVLQALDNIAQTLNNIPDNSDFSFLPTISSSVEQLSRQLEPQFTKLGEAYKSIFTSDGFTLDDVDNSMLEDLRKSFAEIEEAVGVTFDASALNSFFDALTSNYANTEEGAKQVQQAFNELATAYFYSTETLDQLNAETSDAIEKQLEEMGVQNAAEIVADALTAKTEELIVAKEYLAQTGQELASATEEEQTAFILEQIEAGNCGEALALLQLKKVLVNSTQINTSADIQQIMNLASAAGMGAEVLAQLANAKNILSTVEAGGNVSLASYEKALSDIESAKQTLLNWKPVEVDFGNVGGGASQSGSAGKEAGDAYVEAYEKELAALGDLRDQGKISEYQYLQECRKLYEKYFKDIEKYAENFAKAQADYLNGMKSLYESVFSHLTSQIDNRIDAINNEKDAAVDSLNAQKEAAEAAYQAQIDGIQGKIDALEEEKKANQKIIDGLQDEIDAINDAAKARQREIDLQKAQYNLERMMNQRTNFIYKQGDDGVPGQMVYEADTTGIRDARNEVEDAKDQIRIGEIEKQIDYYEKLNESIDETIESYELQIDAIEKMIDKSNAYYDSLISQTEKYYDTLTKSLDNQKSKFEELQELFDKAKMEQVLKELGINEEALLNGSIEEFNKLRDGYLGILKDMTDGNAGFQQALSDLSGVDMSSLTGYLDATADSLGKVGDNTANVDAVATATENLGTSATTASESMNELKESTSGIFDDLSSIQTGISGIDSTGISATTEAFNLLADAIGNVAGALGIGTADTVGGLLSALEEISTFTLSGEEGTGIISQFENLATAVSAVSAAISGEGGGSVQSGDGSNSSSPSMSDGATGNGSSVTSALDSLKEKADEVLGSGSREGSGGKGTDGNSGVTGQFETLKGTVDDVSAAIGVGGEGSEKGGTSGEEDAATLTGAIENLGKTATTVLTGGEDSENGGMISQFEELNPPLAEATGYVNELKTALEDMDGKTFTITLEVNGGVGGSQSFSASYGAQADGTAHVDIPAHVEGKWGASESSESLVGELGREGIVRNGRFFTVGENGAEMFKVQKGDIVFNHVQTEQLLKHGSITGRGKAYAAGTVTNVLPSNLVPIGNAFANGTTSDLLSKFKLLDNNLLYEKFKNLNLTQQFVPQFKVPDYSKTFANVNNNRQPVIQITGDNNFNCPGVTIEQVSRQIEGAFEGMVNNAYQHVMKS